MNIHIHQPGTTLYHLNEQGIVEVTVESVHITIERDGQRPHITTIKYKIINDLNRDTAYMPSYSLYESKAAIKAKLFPE